MFPCVCVYIEGCPYSSGLGLSSAGVHRVTYTGAALPSLLFLTHILGDLAVAFVCPGLAEGFQCRHERELGCQTADGKVCVMQKEFQASFWLILFFRGLLMWLDGNLHVECSLRLLEYFQKWFSKVFLKISLNWQLLYLRQLKKAQSFYLYYVHETIDNTLANTLDI